MALYLFLLSLHGRKIRGLIMDDELRSLQEKLHAVSARLSDLSLNKQTAEALVAEYRQLLKALDKFTPAN